MNRRRAAAAAIAVLLTVAALAAALSLRAGAGAGTAGNSAAKPELLIVTALPIVFPEELTLEGGGSPALTALERRFRVRPVSTVHAGNLGGPGLLLMAQPQAQTAQALVDLDSWVRGGGRLLLLADPVLQWASALPLGDVRRPPFAYPDTGLLGHWGLELEAPERTGRARIEAGGESVPTLSPGSLVASGNQCTLAAGGVVARCRIGRGQATVVADADFINVEGGAASAAGLDLMLGELDRLAR